MRTDMRVRVAPHETQAPQVSSVPSPAVLLSPIRRSRSREAGSWGFASWRAYRRLATLSGRLALASPCPACSSSGPSRTSCTPSNDSRRSSHAASSLTPRSEPPLLPSSSASSSSWPARAPRRRRALPKRTAESPTSGVASPAWDPAWPPP
eukprot:CAMPEP_0182539422 /NCGR_PEP_ID=MMETSP1323-20130603/25346_1 /TAXON_ID=236787 /ORGANISM="Florenciella parvula, Strain RCC1693" /LENGTH=150 /DNA_ID=CAMNT_0024749983 /DNA_START=38 /DNA_END=487 /DNA_ORIENTATION=-